MQRLSNAGVLTEGTTLQRDSPPRALVIFYLHHRYVRRDDWRGREYSILDAAGSVRFTARAARVPGPMTIWPADAPDRPIVLARPRRLFAVSGRYDVIEPPDRRLGVITRSGRFYDANGRKLGRFKDARSLKQHVGEGVMTVIVEGLIAGDGGTGEGPGASGFVVMLEGAPPGRLARERLPFYPDEESARPRSGPVVNTLRRVLPKKAGDALLERNPPLGWKLDLPDSGGIPEPLLLAAVLLAIEVALW
jgi:hypothetical protein